MMVSGVVQAKRLTQEKPAVMLNDNNLHLGFKLCSGLSSSVVEHSPTVQAVLGSIPGLTLHFFSFLLHLQLIGIEYNLNFVVFPYFVEIQSGAPGR